MPTSKQEHSDFLVIGTGVAGLSFALKAAQFGTVTILTKSDVSQTNSSMAQGGIAAVTSQEDSFEKHIQDTLEAGAGLCHPSIVKMVVEQAPDRIRELQTWGVEFDGDLTREGGHRERRVLHVRDQTGKAVHTKLLEACKKNHQIRIIEHQFAIDLITDKKMEPFTVGAPRCLGAYVLNTKTQEVVSFLARATILSTGGAGKVYLYTSNWSGATGDGIAMAYRAKARVANLEFMQFHPTCLFHPEANNFLVTEAIRGEGGVLKTKSGEAFMKKYHHLESLAPRDIVARSIDAEMKKSGDQCVYLDITHQNPDFIMSHFPNIYKKSLSLGIDMTKEPIPVVPAAHYLCGGILVDHHGQTDLQALFAIGENSCSGLHGANRLASNSLLECLAFAHESIEYISKNMDQFPVPKLIPPDWIYHGNEDQDEMIVISHMWDEIRRLMWNYVGIVRSDKRLERAEHRLSNLISEVRDYYWNFKLHPDVLELRNIALVAHLTVQCALKRRESRGIHFNIDCPGLENDPTKDSAQDTIV